MSYFSLRITPCQVSPPDINLQSFLILFTKIIDKYNPSHYLLGYEKLNKFLEPVNPHFHFQFFCHAKKDTIRQLIARWDVAKVRGNKAYALSLFPDVQDHDRFFRYCLKEENGWINNKKYIKGFSYEEILDMQKLAQDERKTNADYHKKNREKQLQKSTFFSRLEQHLNKLYGNDLSDNPVSFSKLPSFPSHKMIYIDIINYYMTHQNAINHKTVRGYTILYQLRTKIITPEEFFHMNNGT